MESEKENNVEVHNKEIKKKRWSCRIAQEFKYKKRIHETKSRII